MRCRAGENSNVRLAEGSFKQVAGRHFQVVPWCWEWVPLWALTGEVRLGIEKPETWATFDLMVIQTGPDPLTSPCVGMRWRHRRQFYNKRRSSP